MFSPLFGAWTNQPEPYTCHPTSPCSVPTGLEPPKDPNLTLRIQFSILLPNPTPIRLYQTSPWLSPRRRIFTPRAEAAPNAPEASNPTPATQPLQERSLPNPLLTLFTHRTQVFSRTAPNPAIKLRLLRPPSSNTVRVSGGTCRRRKSRCKTRCTMPGHTGAPRHRLPAVSVPRLGGNPASLSVTARRE